MVLKMEFTQFTILKTINVFLENFPVISDGDVRMRQNC